jgi:hypothetical protein
MHRNNKFTVRVYDLDMNTLYEAADISVSTLQLPAMEWQNIRAKARMWTVQGSNSDDPSTGPFSSGIHKIQVP